MTNNFLVFDENNNNILNDSQYKNDAERVGGMTQGISRSILFNKALRQSTIMAAAVGEVLNRRGYDASDSSISTLVTNIDDAFPQSRGIPVGTLIEVTGNVTNVPVGTLRPDGTPFDPSKYKELANAYRISEDTYIYGQTFIGGVWWPNTPNKSNVETQTLQLDYGKTINFNAYYINWTAPSDGQIFVSGHDNIRCRINGQEFYIGGRGYNYESIAGSSFLVSKGDIINIVANWTPTNQKFTPMKISNTIDNNILIVAYSGFNLPDMSKIGPSYVEYPIVLGPGGWDQEGKQTINISGVASTTHLDLGLPVPTTRENADAAGASNIIIEDVDTETITLSCARVPTKDLTMLIKIWSN